MSIKAHTSCQSDNPFEEMSTSSTWVHDVSTARGSPTWVMRWSVNTTVDAVRIRPDSERWSASSARIVDTAVSLTGFLRRWTNEKDDITVIFQIIKGRIEVTIAFIKSIGKRSPEYFSSSHINLQRNKRPFFPCYVDVVSVLVVLTYTHIRTRSFLYPLSNNRVGTMEKRQGRFDFSLSRLLVREHQSSTRWWRRLLSSDRRLVFTIVTTILKEDLTPRQKCR